MSVPSQWFCALLDTAPDMVAAANGLRADAGLDTLPLATLRPFVSKGGRAILRAASEASKAADYLLAFRPIWRVGDDADPKPDL